MHCDHCPNFEGELLCGRWHYLIQLSAHNTGYTACGKMAYEVLWANLPPSQSACQWRLVCAACGQTARVQTVTKRSPPQMCETLRKHAALCKCSLHSIAQYMCWMCGCICFAWDGVVWSRLTKLHMIFLWFFLIMAFKKESNLIRITFNKVLIFCFLCWRLDVSFLFFLLQHYTFWRSSLVPVLQDIKKSFFQSKFIICFWGIYFF